MYSSQAWGHVKCCMKSSVHKEEKQICAESLQNSSALSSFSVSLLCLFFQSVYSCFPHSHDPPKMLLLCFHLVLPSTFFFQMKFCPNLPSTHPLIHRQPSCPLLFASLLIPENISSSHLEHPFISPSFSLLFCL